MIHCRKFRLFFTQHDAFNFIQSPDHGMFLFMEFLATTIFVSLGVVSAAAVTYVIVDRRLRGKLHDAQTAAMLAEQKNTDMALLLDEARKASAEISQQHDVTRTELIATREKLAGATVQIEAGEKNILAQKQLLDQANSQLSKAFAQLSAEALDKNTAAFLQIAETRFKTLSTEASGSLEQRKTAIEGMLKPLQEMLNQYQRTLADIESRRQNAYSGLHDQLGRMAQIETTLQAQTQSLVTALTRPHVRGQWGELTLRKLVELAGLQEHCDFDQQVSVNDINDDAARLRPDMIINLPGERRIIIDAKAVLSAFLDASAANDDATKQACLKRHAEYVRSRVKDLAGKNYWSQFKNTPEMVVLFLPGEAFLYAAVEYDAALLEDCLRDKVILATPTTLIALLKTVEYGWRQEKLGQNAEAICDLGKTMYDRLAVLADHLAKLGKSLDSSVENYNRTIGSLETKFLVSARKMADLGARGTTEIPESKQIEKRTRELAAELHPDKSPLLPDEKSLEA